MFYNDILSNHYSLYPNGDLIVYPIKEHAGHVITENDRTKERKFQLSYAKYRIITSAAIWLLKCRSNKVIFLTLTFNEKLKLDDKQANRVLGRFLKNFKKTYNCKNYIGTLEHTELDTPHYHFMFDFPYIDIRKIDSVWVGSIAAELGINGASYRLGSVRLPKNSPSVVGDSKGVIRYICKYFSKEIGRKYTGRCYFISREIRQLSGARQLTPEQFVFLTDNLNAVKSKHFDNCSVLLFNPVDIQELGIQFEIEQDITKQIYQ